MFKPQIVTALLTTSLIFSTTQAQDYAKQYQVPQGDTLELNIPQNNATYLYGTFEKQSILFEKKVDTTNPANTTFHGYVGIHRELTPGIKNLHLTFFTPGQGSIEDDLSINVTKKTFATNHFSLPKQTQNLFQKDYQTPTWNLINAAKQDSPTSALWTDAFLLPTKGRITLGYGDKLYINKKYSGSHFGIDYANKTGTPVLATNTGIVKMSSDTPAYGKVIIIDHGLNIYSMYLHLDKLIATVGQTVQKGDEIAEMGSTGLSSGPHLHFTMFIGTTIINPAQWLNK